MQKSKIIGGGDVGGQETEGADSGLAEKAVSARAALDAYDAKQKDIADKKAQTTAENQRRAQERERERRNSSCCGCCSRW